MSKKDGSTAQVFDLLFSFAEALGVTRDKDLAQLVGVSPETIQNWRTGAVGELKPSKLEQVKTAFGSRVASLREGTVASALDLESGMTHVDISPDASPSQLQRQLRDRMHYDYLGHRFLYFEPQGALAWENLISGGYEQATWVHGVREQARDWLQTGRNKDGTAKGPIAAAVSLGRRGRTRGLDVISLGPGEGSKEVAVLEELEALEEAVEPLPWRSMTLVDVSISLLIRAALAARRAVASLPMERKMVRAVCADFEEGPLDFERRLSSSRHEEDASRRLVLVLGNVFGNVRHEDTFVRQKLSFLVRPGDLVWLEVGIRAEKPELDPVYRLTQPSQTETAAEANRRLLLEGPYRRWEAARGRRPAEIDLRVWVREDDDSTTVPGSYNFCHDLVLTAERRAITMLYSRRYDVDGLVRWLEQRGFAVERIAKVSDSRRVDRVVHLLLRRTEA